jgi:regulation of enolase protein 1 (concanavalin A-like superfamily)
MLVCMLAAANAGGAVFLDDFNRADGAVGNGWTTQTNGTITVQIVDNEVLIKGTEGASAWARAGITRPVTGGVTRASFDFKADDVFNVHLNVQAANSPAWLEIYAWEGGPFSYANSETGAWPAGPWTAIPGSDMVPGAYNNVALEFKDKVFSVILNGKVVGTIPNAAFTTIESAQFASDADAGQTGTLHIDNVQIGTIIPGSSKDPSPATNATDVPRDGTLGWTAGQYAATHNVYLGASFDDVNNADISKAASKGQTGTTFKPADLLEFGKTYYWRVDEVNAAPSNTVFKGDVWSFTAEPYSYPLTGVTATASSFEKATTPAANTVNGSGMTGDLHGTNTSTMWNTSMAASGPAWIQYQFDNAYKLSELWVWNYNGEFEPVLGYGFKDVTIEYSLDGQTWTLLKDTQFAQATAVAGYAHNTTVDMGGVVAQYVKLTAKSNWSMVGLKQYGLSEVRFFYIPAQARAPQPALAATGVSVDSSLDWRSGRDMTSEQVYFGTDQAAVSGGTAAAQTVTSHGFDPGSLDFGTTYYWKVDEVGTATYPGALWSFTTQEFAPVEDFESYGDDEGSRIYETWVDGWTNNTGSVVGYLQSPFAETNVVHGGKQAMPFEYNNIKTPYYSETERTFDTPQDWTANGADSVALWFQGFPTGFTDKGNNAFTVVSTGTDIWNNDDQFRFAYKQLSGNGSITAKVESVTRSDGWTKAGVMIRETLDANAKHASVVVTPDNSCSQQYRNMAGGPSASTDWSGAAVRAPYWVRVTRTGTMFKTETSPDGKTWTALGADRNIPMVTNVYIGLAVTSHNPGAYSTAEFSNVSSTGTGAWQNVSIGVAQRSNGIAPLYLTVEDKAGKKKTVVNPDAAAVTKGTWTQWKIPLADLSGVNAAAVKKLTIGVGDPANPQAGAAGMLYIDDIQYGKAAAVDAAQP